MDNLEITKSPFKDQYDNGDPKFVIYRYNWENDSFNRTELRDCEKSDIIFRIREADHTYSLTMLTDNPIQMDNGRWSAIGLNYKQNKGF